jgi:anthranilate phosphoribosyltransferase
MIFRDTLNRLLARQDLGRDEMLALMRALMGGELTPAQIAAVVIALRCKGETVTEIAAAAEVMRELSAKVAVADRSHLVDTCGTGGDSLHTFNISTTAAFVAAACGARVAKHGGRAVSSGSGSADVLEHLGVRLDVGPERVGRLIDSVGLGFLFAPNHHSAMRHAAPVRRELGVRTLFNVLGPLTNPAGAPNQVLGVFSGELTCRLAEVLQTLGSHHVLVVHGADGLDEITLSGETHVAELKDGAIREYTLTPERFGMVRSDLCAIRVDGVAQSAQVLREVLDGRPGPAADIVALNAGAAVYAAGVADSLEDGVARAQSALVDGSAAARLQALVTASAG